MLRYLFLAGMLAVAVSLSAAFPSQSSAATKVLFDQGHGQQFGIDRNNDLDLSRLAELVRNNGATVAPLSSPITRETLAETDALVLSGPFHTYSAEETAAIRAFVERGGALCIMLHIAPPVASLLEPFGIVTSNSVIHEQNGVIDGNPLNFRVAALSQEPLFDGVSDFNIHGGWALLPEQAELQAVASTSPDAWVDLNGNGKLDSEDAVQQFAVAVAGRHGNGRLLVFGDDAIFQNKFLTGGNLTLARNLAAWLATPAATSPR